MAGATIQNVRFAGLASAVPGEPQTVVPSGELTEDDLKKVVANTGVRRRHLAATEVCTSDLCFAAAERLLDGLAWPRDSVDLLIFVSQTPDHVLPATSCILHGRLGLGKNCAAFDVALGCSGYIYGLSIAAHHLASGQFRRALLLVGDTISKLVSPADRSVAYLFGDAGTATALEYDPAAAPMHFELGTDGSGASHLQVAGGMFRQPSSEETRQLKARAGGNVRSDEQLEMNGAEIFNFTLREVPPLLRRILERAGLSPDAVQGWVFHQANRFMLDHLARRLKLSGETFFMALEDFGNTSSASIPLAITSQGGARLQSDSTRLVLAGFGVGFSWGATALTVSKPFLPPLIKTSTGVEA
jgi:3-oxoacyl-[acyl-carrier-protein] synthase-3